MTLVEPVYCCCIFLGGDHITSARNSMCKSKWFFLLHGRGRAPWLQIQLEKLQGEEPRLLLPLRNEVQSSRVGITGLPFFGVKATG